MMLRLLTADPDITEESTLSHCILILTQYLTVVLMTMRLILIIMSPITLASNTQLQRRSQLTIQLLMSFTLMPYQDTKRLTTISCIDTLLLPILHITQLILPIFTMEMSMSIQSLLMAFIQHIQFTMTQSITMFITLQYTMMSTTLLCTMRLSIMLQSTTRPYTTLQCIMRPSTMLQYIMLRYITSQCIMLQYITLLCTTRLYTIPQYTTSPSITPQCITKSSITLLCTTKLFTIHLYTTRLCIT